MIKVDTTAQRQNGISVLLGVSTSKGYITFDDILDVILDVIDRLELPLDDVDRISGQLLSVGCIIKETNEQISVEESKEDFSDRSKLDYEVIYAEVLALDPSLAEYIKCLRQIRPPALRETENLIYQAKNGNEYAKTRIVTMYLKVVVRIALWASKKYKIPVEDAIQNGNIGLVIAVGKFESLSDNKFSTYAPWWIRQIISREAPTVNPLIYFPAYIKEKLFELYDIVFEHKCEKCTDYSFCEELVALVMNKSQVDYSTAIRYLEYICPSSSIDDLFDKNKDEIFSDFGLMEYEMLTKVNTNQASDTISELISHLKPREQEVLQARFGFVNNAPKTLEQVGQVIGVTRERVRQIEVKALSQIKHSSGINLLKELY